MSSLSIGTRILQCRPTHWGQRSAHQSCGPCSKEPHSHPQSTWFNAARHTHTLTLPFLNRTHSCLMALCNHIRSKVGIIITSPVITDFRQEPGTENRGLAHLKPVLKQVLDQYELKYSYLWSNILRSSMFYMWVGICRVFIKGIWFWYQGTTSS